MTIKHSTRLFATLLILAMMLLFASCNIFQNTGSLKLESFIVELSSIKTEYEVGEKIDFSGIKAIAKYNDASLNKTYVFDELTIVYPEDITETEGTKKVVVSFMDPHLNVKQQAIVAITVVKAEVTTPGGDEVTTPDGGDIVVPPTLPEVVEFLKPSGLVGFDNANKNAGTLSYGQNGFAGQFAIGGQVYVIGNQNEFKLNPSFAVWDEEANDGEGDIVELKDFFTTVEISIKKDGEYVLLTATEKENNVVEYFDGETLVASVNTYKGIYQFAVADVEVKISVLPSEEKYVVEDINAIVLEAKIIDAYNVYEAWQLAVIDNRNSAWADIKTAYGIADVNVSGIVLHNNITLTADDVPASFFYTTEKDVVYTNSIDAEDIKTIPAGTRFLIDGTFIYERQGVSDFVIEGNFFTLNAKNFPLIASPGVFGRDAEKDYGVDFSNAALFRFDSLTGGVSYVEGMDVADVTVNNISLIGNAARDNYVDATESLASAGGLIFFKASFYTNTTLNNVIGNSYFITYFTENANMYVNNSKCYDSYQNAAFIWGECNFEMTDSYMNGCGGPVIIAMSLPKSNENPIVNVTGGQLETHVSGEEIWFTAVNANTIVGQIKGLGAALQQAGLGNFVDANGKMNILGAIMAEGNDAAQIVTGIDAQGSFSVDGDGINRFQNAENINWMTMLQISQYAAQMTGTMPPFFTVQDAEGTAYTIYFNGTTFVDLSGKELGTDASHAAIAAAFMQADSIILTQGGLSVGFEFYH